MRKDKLSRQSLYNFHSLLGILTGLVMILIGFSGSLAVFNDEVEWVFNPEIRVSSEGSLVSIDSIVSTLENSTDDGSSFQLTFPPGERWAYTAIGRMQGNPVNILVNSKTGEITESVVREGYTWSVSFWVRQFHVRLLMGYWGRAFVGIFGVLLLVSCVTGVLIYRNWLKSLFQLRLGFRKRVAYMDLHKVIGIWSLLFNVVIAISGAVLGLENLYRRIERDWFPEANVRAIEMQQQASWVDESSEFFGEKLPVSKLIGLAEDHYSEFEVTQINFPDSDSGDPLVIRGDHPGALIAKSQSRVTIDPKSGRILSSSDAREIKVSSKLYNTLDPLHFGYFGRDFGSFVKYLVKILWAFLGLAPGVLAITGSIMWWMRRKRVIQSKQLKKRLPHKNDDGLVLSTNINNGWNSWVLSLIPFLIIAYILQARVWLGDWSFSLNLVQQLLVKPISLSIVAFPITYWLYSFTSRLRRQTIGREGGFWWGGMAGGLFGLWYLILTSLFN